MHTLILVFTETTIDSMTTHGKLKEDTISSARDVFPEPELPAMPMILVSVLWRNQHCLMEVGRLETILTMGESNELVPYHEIRRLKSGIGMELVKVSSCSAMNSPEQDRLNSHAAPA